jgi:hypothetical protein
LDPGNERKVASKEYLFDYELGGVADIGLFAVEEV